MLAIRSRETSAALKKIICYGASLLAGSAMARQVTITNSFQRPPNISVSPPSFLPSQPNIVVTPVLGVSPANSSGSGTNSSGTVTNSPTQSRVRNFNQVNLVSDVLPRNARLRDADLVNAWGISSSTNSPFWIANNGSGTVTLYAVTNNSAGSPRVTKVPLTVNVPGAGSITGLVFNDDPASFNGAQFVFVSEDGTISGWRNALGANAEVLTVNSNAVYKGVTLATAGGETVLLAANFLQGTVDVYDGDMNPVAQLVDPDAPEGYAPFNVQAFGDTVFVTYAMQDNNGEVDVPGQGHGFINVLDVETRTFDRFATGSNAGGNVNVLNSPWGMAIAPASFGGIAGDLLVGNFGSGTIAIFDQTGRLQGLLEQKPGNTLVIDGLWGLTVGNGGKGGDPNILYFTAGPLGETHGLFGSLEPVTDQKKQK